MHPSSNNAGNGMFNGHIGFHLRMCCVDGSTVVKANLEGLKWCSLAPLFHEVAHPKVKRTYQKSKWSHSARAAILHPWGLLTSEQTRHAVAPICHPFAGRIKAADTAKRLAKRPSTLSKSLMIPCSSPFTFKLMLESAVPVRHGEHMWFP